MKRSEVRRLRKIIELAAEFLTDGDALKGVELFRQWKVGGQYTAGQRVCHAGILYRCLQSHTAQAGWTPGAADSLWTKVLIPDENTIFDWVQPDSTNGYMAGDKVRHHEKVWVSMLDNNCWEPGIYGWEVAA